MKLAAKLGLACCLFIVACSPKKESFPISKEQVLHEQNTFRGQLFIILGADGPYKPGPGFVGNYDTAGSFRILDQTISYPATPDYFYEGYSYINSQKKALIAIRKVSKADISKKAEQDAAANP